MRHAGETSGLFDAFDLAAARASIEGSVAARDLERVGEELAEAPAEGGTIRYRIVGTADEGGRPAVELTLEGGVALVCQRCLRDFMLPVRSQTLLVLARDERDSAALDQATMHEVVIASSPLSELALVEDELLLTLPYAARHADPAQCAAPAS